MMSHQHPHFINLLNSFSKAISAMRHHKSWGTRNCSVFIIKKVLLLKQRQNAGLNGPNHVHVD